MRASPVALQVLDGCGRSHEQQRCGPDSRSRCLLHRKMGADQGRREDAVCFFFSENTVARFIGIGHGTESKRMPSHSDLGRTGLPG